MPVKKDKIIIFGGSSFIGSKLIKYLKNDYEIINVSKKNKLKDIKNLNVDFSKNFSVQKFKNIKPKYIFFLTSLDHNMSEKNFTKSLQINFYSLCKILENKSIKSNLKTVIYLSTLQVYGDNKIISSERILTDPKNIYGLTHNLCEDYLKYFTNKNFINSLIFRISNSYGPPHLERESSFKNVTNDFIKSAFTKNKILIKSHGFFKRDFIYIDDLCKIIIKVFKNFKGYKIVNLGSFESNSLIDIASKVKNVGEKYLKKKIDIKVLGNKPKIKKFKLIFKSNNKYKYNLTSFEKGILNTFKYLKKNK